MYKLICGLLILWCFSLALGCELMWPRVQLSLLGPEIVDFMDQETAEEL